MPKNLYPDNMLKRKKPSRVGAVLSALLIIVAIALSVMVALLMSNFITVGSFSFLNNSELKKNGYKIYAVSCYQNTVYSSACQFAESDKDKNGAGFVFFSEGIYHVLQSGYKEKSDADKVIEKLSESGVNAEILTIAVPTINISGSFSSSQTTAINNALMCFSNSFDSLYDMAVALDTKVSSSNDIKNQLESLLSSVKNVRSTFNNTFSSSMKDQILEISLSLGDVVEYIDDLIEIKSENLISNLKHCYFQIVDEHISLNKLV